MADINSELTSILAASSGTLAWPDGAIHPSAPEPADEAGLLAFVELLFFAYRDFTSDPDSVLAGLGLGRAHHRALHFVHRFPGLRVAELLDILKITKQSLARVLKQLIESGFIEQRPGPTDLRERLLHATPDGRALAERLVRPQLTRIAQALDQSGPNAALVAREFLFGMITQADRTAVAELIKSQPSGENALNED